MATFRRPESKKPRMAAEGGAGVGGLEQQSECLAGRADLISDLPDAPLMTAPGRNPCPRGGATSGSPPHSTSATATFAGGPPASASWPVVSRVLSAHRGPVRRLSLGWRSSLVSYPDLDSWLRSPALDNCRSSSCNLKQLTVQRIDIAENALHTLLSKCPVLESLVLSQNEGFQRIRISSTTLRSFGVSNDRRDVWDEEGRDVWDLERLKEVIIEGAPLLQRFFIRYSGEGDGPLVRMSGAPKLEFLGSLTLGITTLELGTTILKETMPLNSTAVVRTVKVLVVAHVRRR